MQGELCLCVFACGKQGGRQAMERRDGGTIKGMRDVKHTSPCERVRSQAESQSGRERKSEEMRLFPTSSFDFRLFPLCVCASRDFNFLSRLFSPPFVLQSVFIPTFPPHTSLLISSLLLQSREGQGSRVCGSRNALMLLRCCPFLLARLTCAGMEATSPAASASTGLCPSSLLFSSRLLHLLQRRSC